MTTLWPDDRIVNRLNQNTIYLLPRHAALTAGQEMRDEYEEALDYRDEIIDSHDATIAALRAENVILEEEVDALYVQLARLQADAYVEIATESTITSRLRTGLTIVDNNLMFSGAEPQKQLARTNLSGKWHDIGGFVESFGHGQTLPSWNGLDTMPALDFSLIDADLNTNYAALGSPRLHTYMWRLPWQLTGNYNPSTGVHTPSTSSDYNSDGRRVRPTMMAQYTEWCRRVGQHMMDTWGCMIYHDGSEWKGYQESGSAWNWQAYFDKYVATRTGLRQAATDLGLNPDDVIVIGPYPVVAHQGDAGVGTGQADAVIFDSRNDSEGNPVDYSIMNGNHATYGGWGYPNKAPLEGIDEFLRLCQANSIPLPVFGVDFGTFNNDNVPTPNISDHDLAYLRVKRHLQWYKQRLEARGFPDTKICLDEWYAKAQWQMQVEGEHFIPEDLRDDYQASIKAAFLIACLEEGLHLPMIWSPFGRGDQSTDAGIQSDPNQWYGGMVVRTVVDNNHNNPVSNGGEAQAFLGVVEALHAHFAEGTPLHEVTFSEPGWRGIASATHALIVNESGEDKTLALGSEGVAFAPYQYRLVEL